MPIHKKFGSIETDKVLVRIQRVLNGKVVSTQTFGVYGYDYDSVVGTIENQLNDVFNPPVAQTVDVTSHKGPIKVKRRKV